MLINTGKVISITAISWAIIGVCIMFIITDQPERDIKNTSKRRLLYFISGPLIWWTLLMQSIFDTVSKIETPVIRWICNVRKWFRK